MQTNTDYNFLNQALVLANKCLGLCSPNPAVGCVLVNPDQKIVSQGYHLAAGQNHAEVNALNNLTNANKNLTLYVTLEPCTHFGKTPPCVNAIIESKVITRVVYGYKDPNPLVNNKAKKILQDNGIDCDYMPIPEIEKFYSAYSYWLKNKKPFVTAKIAISLNGMIATEDSTSVKLTSNLIDEFTHQNRAVSDAILTTINTILADDPQLNARLGENTLKKKLYILDSKLRLPLDAQVFTTTQSITIFYSFDDENKELKLRKQGCKLIKVDRLQSAINLTSVLTHIGEDGIHSLWVEAGGKCFASFVNAKLLQKAFIYIAPKWINHGKIAFANGFDKASLPGKKTYRQYGEDILCEINF